MKSRRAVTFAVLLTSTAGIASGQQAQTGESSQADANEGANPAKAAALPHLPSFTNQIVTISTLAGPVYTNIALVRASPDGIIYRSPGSVGGGLIRYTNLSPGTLEALGIDTNPISVAQERAGRNAAANVSRGAIPSQAQYGANAKLWMNDPGWQACENAIRNLEATQAPLNRQYAAIVAVIQAKKQTKQNSSNEQRELTDLQKQLSSLGKELSKCKAQQKQIQAGLRLREATQAH